MKAAKGSIGRALDQPGRDIRFYLFHGPDEAGRARWRAAAEALGARSSIVLAAGAVKSDPALLADEAAR
jgi:DNA polymerase-3 subunit delta